MPPGRTGAPTPTRAWPSWATRCSGLSITAHLYPRLEAERYGAGRLTKIRAQTVSGPSCRAVAERLGVPDFLAAAAPEGVGQSASTLVATERVLASVIEAVIGACYLHAGYEAHGGGGRRGLRARDRARPRPSGGLQVLAAGAPGPARRDRQLRRHRRARPAARPHLRGARLGRRAPGGHRRRGARRSTPSRRPRARRWRCSIPPTRTSSRTDAPQVADPQGLQVVPGPHQARLRLGGLGRGGAQRLGQVQRDRRGAVGDGRAVAAGRARAVDAGRDLRRRQGRAGALGGRGRARARQLRRRRRPAHGRDLDPAPPGSQRRGRVPPQRRPLPPGRRPRGALRHGPGQGVALGRLAGPRRGDGDLQAARPAPADRGGRRAGQAPQAPAPRAAQARAHAGQPRSRARRRARGALAPAPAQAPGRGGRAARAPRAPDRRGPLGACARRRARPARGARAPPSGRPPRRAPRARRRRPRWPRSRAAARRPRTRWRGAPRSARRSPGACTPRARRPSASSCAWSARARRPRRSPSASSAAGASWRACARRPSEDTPDEAGRERIEALQAQLDELDAERADALERELAALAAQRDAAAARAAELGAAVAERRAALDEADEAGEVARTARRAAESSAEAARRDAARVGAELASAQPVPAHPRGGRAWRRFPLAGRRARGRGRATSWRWPPALGGRLSAAIVDDLAAARVLLERVGADGGRALVADSDAPGVARTTRAAGARGAPPGRHGHAGRPVAVGLARRLLANTWVVEDLDQLPPGFMGVAVTRAGRAWFGFTRELRQAPRGGSERVLAERNRRDALVRESERAVQAEQGALAGVEAAMAAVQAADATREEADRAVRDADRARAQAAEEERRAAWLIDERSRAPEQGESAVRRAQISGELAAERRVAERAARERAERAARIERLAAALVRDRALLPVGAPPGGGAGAAPWRPSPCASRRSTPSSLADRQAGEGVAVGPARVRHRGGRDPEPPARARRRRHRRRGPRPAGARRRARRRRGARRAGRAPGPRGPAGRRAAGRRDRRRPARAHRAPAAPPRAARPGQPAGQGRVRRGPGARRGARAPARGPRDRAARAQGPHPRHRPPDPRDLRGHLHRRGEELRGAGRAALPGRPRAPATGARGLRPAPGAGRRRRRRRRRGPTRPPRRPSPRSGASTPTTTSAWRSRSRRPARR